MACEALKQNILDSSKNDCEDDPSTPATYVVPCKNVTLLDADIGVRTATFGPEGNGKPKKVILVAGDRVDVMEFWLGGLINYVTGVEWKDNFRFKWLEDGVAWDWAKVHTLNWQEGYKIDYNLVVAFVPKYKPQLLKEIGQYFPEIDEYYYICAAKKLKEEKRMKMWGRDLNDMGSAPWSLILTGSGTGTQDFMAKHMDDFKSYCGKTYHFPNPEITYLDHKEPGGEVQYNGNLKAYEEMLQ